MSDPFEIAELRTLIEELRALIPVGDEQTTIVEYTPGGAVMRAIPTQSLGGDSEATSWPAQITAYSAALDQHTVSLFGNGFNDTPTATGIILNSIMNLATNAQLPNGLRGNVSLNGGEYIGQFNGIF